MILIIPNVIEELVFDRVSSALKFLSSLMPCLEAMVIRSRQKILSSFLVKTPNFQSRSVYFSCFFPVDY